MTEMKSVYCNDRKLTTCKDAGTALGLSEATIRQHAQQGKLPGIVEDGQLYIFDLDGFMESIKAKYVPSDEGRAH